MALIAIRGEEPGDHEAVFEINRRAFEEEFGSSAEATLVDRLRAQAKPLVSLVAELDGQVAGYILFTPVGIRAASGAASAPPDLVMALGPMAVRPGVQGQGIGSKLVVAGLDECRDLGAGAVVVFGHADYYPRFGFQPARGFGLEYQGPEHDRHFFAMELEEGSLSGCEGSVEYHPAFTDAEP